jgi:hypothetical protein
MKRKIRIGLAVAVVLCAVTLLMLFAYAHRDPEGLLGVEVAFREAGPHKARVDKLLAAARTQHYFTAVSGFQWLRTDPTLNLDQITALQDAIGKMQARLAAQAQSGDKTAARHLQAIQNETDLKD